MQDVKLEVGRAAGGRKGTSSKYPRLRLRGEFSTEPNFQENDENEPPHDQLMSIGSAIVNDGRLKQAASTFELYCLGITIVIGGQLFSWNEGLEDGFYPMLVSTFFMGSAYLCLVLCIAEMTSTLPFSGGTYGFVRVALGSFPGAIVGYSEMILNICYVGSSVLSLGKMITMVTGLAEAYEPLYWAMFFISALGIHCRPGPVFLTFNVIIAVISILLILVYFLSTAPLMSFAEHIHEQYVESAHSPTSETYELLALRATFHCLPLTSWWYVGIEMLPLAANESKEPRRSLPVAMILSMLTLLVSSFAMLFAVSSQAPGPHGAASLLLPLNYGYGRALRMSSRFASLLSLPAVYGTCYGFMFNYSRQMASMMRSRLLPSFKSNGWTARHWPLSVLLHVPVPIAVQLDGTAIEAVADPEEDVDDFIGKRAISAKIRDNMRAFHELASIKQTLMLGTLLGLILMVFIFLHTHSNAEIVFLVCILGGYLVYGSILVCFIIFRFKYSSLGRSFVNPLGIGSAVYAMVVFAASAASVIALHSVLAVYATVAFLVIAALYYFKIAQYTQCFSEDEQKVLFSAYIINVNTHTKRKGRQYKTSNVDANSERTTFKRNILRNLTLSRRNGTEVSSTPADSRKMAEEPKSNENSVRSARTFFRPPVVKLRAELSGALSSVEDSSVKEETTVDDNFTTEVRYKRRSYEDTTLYLIPVCAEDV